jgi:hypothetical protein
VLIAHTLDSNWLRLVYSGERGLCPLRPDEMAWLFAQYSQVPVEYVHANGTKGVPGFAVDVR